MSEQSKEVEAYIEYLKENDYIQFSENVLRIRGASSRPGLGGPVLGRDRLSNYPYEDGTYEIYRDDVIPLSTYQKMSCDPTIAFGTFLLKGWVGGLPYTIECSDKLIKGVVDHVLDKIWNPMIRDMMDAVKNGFAFGEKVWEREDVKIVSDDDEGNRELIYDGKITCLQKVKFLNPAHRFRYFMRNDEITRVEQIQRLRAVNVKRDKLVWFALDREYSSVFGRSRYKNIYSDWYFSNVNIKYLLNDLKKRGSPHLEIRYPPGRSRIGGQVVQNDEIAMMMAKQLMSQGVVVIPSEVFDNGTEKWSIQFADTKQTSSESPFMDFLKYSDQRKMKGLGIPPSVADSDSNFSAADAGGDLLVVVVEDIVNQIEDRIQKDVVDSVVEYNFGPEYKSLVKLKIDKSALGRRNLMKEILKTMLRVGTSMGGSTLKAWPDVSNMMSELGISYTSFDDLFIKNGNVQQDGKTLVEEAQDDEDSNDTDIRRDPDTVTDDDRRATEKDNILDE